MKIPQSKIDEIKQAADIVEVVSQYVAIKLRGRNYVGLCPFHNEKTPSFTVSPDKQIFYCFGCSVGGDAIAFIKNYEKINYPEAIRFLADRYNIELPRFASDEDEKDKSEIETLFYVHKAAARFFYDQLQSSVGTIAREYLNQRGFSEPVLKSFGVGYAPDTWDSLFTFAKSQSLDMPSLEKAGLIMKKNDGGYYDRFRHRIMFPIFSATGRVMAFGGRILRQEPTSPKYVNSPEHPIYQKGKVLYGLFQAKETIRKQDEIIIVEGYADCMSLHQFGITNAAASSGTAFTMDQANLIKRYTQNVTLIYDGDDAGIHAAERGGAIMLQAGLEVKIVVLSKEHDPDTFVRAKGAEAFRELIKQGKQYIDFRIEQWHKDKKLDTVNGRTFAARELINVTANIRDPIKVSLFASEIAEKLRVNESLIYQELKKVSKGHDSLRSAITTAHTKSPDREKLPVNIIRAERGLLKLLLDGGLPGAEKIFSFLRPDDFQNSAIQKVVQFIYTQWNLNESYSESDVVNSFPEDIQKAILRLSMDELLEFDMHDCVATIQYAQLETKLTALRETIKTMEEQNEDTTQLEEVSSLLIKQIFNLKTKKQLITVRDTPAQERITFEHSHTPF
ncbi:DNA primase [bacterium]|nr:MAG: DNA primase [bacterium]